MAEAEDRGKTVETVKEVAWPFPVTWLKPGVTETGGMARPEGMARLEGGPSRFSLEGKAHIMLRCETLKQVHGLKSLRLGQSKRR